MNLNHPSGFFGDAEPELLNGAAPRLNGSSFDIHVNKYELIGFPYKNYHRLNLKKSKKKYFKLASINCYFKYFVMVIFCAFKGTVSRDFFYSRFFLQSTTYMSLINRLKPFCIWHRIRRDNRFESRQNRFQRCR
jgi:hypothetical protein